MLQCSNEVEERLSHNALPLSMPATVIGAQKDWSMRQHKHDWTDRQESLWTPDIYQLAFCTCLTRRTDKQTDKQADQTDRSKQMNKLISQIEQSTKQAMNRQTGRAADRTARASTPLQSHQQLQQQQPCAGRCSCSAEPCCTCATQRHAAGPLRHACGPGPLAPAPGLHCMCGEASMPPCPRLHCNHTVEFVLTNFIGKSW